MTRQPKDDYYVLMWNYMTPMFTGGAETADRAIARFRELGCNGAMLGATFVNYPGYVETLKPMGLPDPGFGGRDVAVYRYIENDFPFYVMNMCRAIYWDWNEAKPIFREQYERFAKDRDRKIFTRVPCVNNPEVAEAIHARTSQVLEI